MNNLRLGVGLVAILSACGGSGDPGGAPAPDAGPVVDLRGLDRCGQGSGSLQMLREVNNAHGNVVAMATDPGGIVALASEDSSVKQWVFGLDGADSLEAPVYGEPFNPGAAVNTALAFSPDSAHSLLVGGNDAGEATVWLPADGTVAHRIQVSEAPIVAVAMHLDKKRVVFANGSVEIWDSEANTLSHPLSTQLWAVTGVAYIPYGWLTAGHIYSAPAIERRDDTNPDQPVDSWQTEEVHTQNVKIAADASGQRVVLAAVDRVYVLNIAHLAAGPAAKGTAVYQTIANLALTPSGESFATLSAEGRLTLWRTADASPGSTIEVPSSVGVGIDDAGEQLFLATSDGHLRAYACQP